MQTFLPYSDFEKTAACLDYRRLGKQRVEVLQILNTLSGNSKGWINHPAVKQWMGYKNTLVDYGVVICNEWKKRGYKDTCLEKILGFRSPNSSLLPQWLGNELYHASHRSALLLKNNVWYSQFGWKEEPKIEYVWPI
jgi:hypothetical protein